MGHWQNGGQNFEGNITIYIGLVRLVDGGHAAFAERSNNLIRAELFAGQVFQVLFSNIEFRFTQISPAGDELLKME